MRNFWVRPGLGAGLGLGLGLESRGEGRGGAIAGSPCVLKHLFVIGVVGHSKAGYVRLSHPKRASVSTPQC